MTLEERLSVLNQYGIDLTTTTIYLAGEIDGNLSTVLRIKIAMLKDYFRIEKEPFKEVNIVLNSYGGDANAITAILDFFDELYEEGIIVNIHAEGVCMSAATFIVAGATGIRKASKRCRFMVHEMQIEGRGGTATQTKASNSEIERMQKECYEIYTEIAFRKKVKNGEKISEEVWDKELAMWEKLCVKETYMSAEEALKKGLIDIVVV